ncbi:hypothetical protein [Tenacibaculum sp. IB213877]|uniref:hypothetical protein n=1 Tax=Tenacibaculum sp. IB213877 TaxID=3097351 RepID=UPI002A59C720|nr:hypothetical protein [Tenacibaculum sp. IB213877]MDY0781120.1 hypothetical protein [Tenacibaculum sp. IB213877]
MKKIIEKPYIAFLALIPIIISIGLLNKDKVFDINVHDIYFVITRIHLSIFISFLFLLISLGYWVIVVFKRRLFRWLTIIHLIITYGSLLFIFIISIDIRNQYNPESYDLSDQNMLLTFGVIIFLFGQIFYSINILLALLRRKN